MSQDIEQLERKYPIIFEEIAEDVYFNGQDYSAEVITEVYKTLANKGIIVGPTVVLELIHDGEVGYSIMATPIDEALQQTESSNIQSTRTIDPLSQGV